MKRLAAAAICLAFSGSLAAPLARSPGECDLFSDMAVVARAMAQEKIDQNQSRRAMQRIYVIDDGRKLIVFELVLVSAYKSSLGARQFAEKLLDACLSNAGNMDSILGTSS